MKDNNHEKVCTQYEVRIANLEKNREELEEKLKKKQSEYNEIVAGHNELINKNSALKEQSSQTEVLLKSKNEELIDIKDQLEILWNQSHHLTNLSPLPNIIPKTDLSALKVLSENYNKSFNDTSQNPLLCKKMHIETMCGNCKEIRKSTSAKQDILTNDVSTSTENINNENADTNSNNYKSQLSLDLSSDEVSAEFCVEGTNEVLGSEDIITKSTEKILNFVVAELTSLQLLHSMFDLTISSLVSKNKCTETPTVIKIPINGSKTRIDELTDKEDDRQSSSTPSGYETGSHRGSQADIHDVLTSEYSADSEEEKTQKGSFLLRPSVSSQITDSLPYISSQDLDLHVLPVDKVSMLYKEIDDQRKSIDQELLKVTCHFIRESMFGSSGKFRKRDIYSQLIQTLSDPILSLKFDLEQLEHLLNLVLVDHSITGCLLTLSHRDKTTDIEKILKRLSTLESGSESFYEGVPDNNDHFDHENEVTIDTERSYVNGCLTSAQSIDEDKLNDETGLKNEPESPLNRKKGIGRFLCVSVRSLRRPKKQKSNKYVVSC